MCALRSLRDERALEGGPLHRDSPCSLRPSRHAPPTWCGSARCRAWSASTTRSAPATSSSPSARAKRSAPRPPTSIATTLSSRSAAGRRQVGGRLARSGVPRVVMVTLAPALDTCASLSTAAIASPVRSCSKLVGRRARRPRTSSPWPVSVTVTRASRFGQEAQHEHRQHLLAFPGKVGWLSICWSAQPPQTPNAGRPAPRGPGSAREWQAARRGPCLAQWRPVRARRGA